MKNNLNKSQLRDAYLVYLFLNSGMGFFSRMVFTVNMVYQVLTVGLNPLQLVLVGTALEVSVMLFEVPTGVVADVYSRRLSVIIGTFIMGLGFVVQGLFPIFEAIVLAQIIWGLGWTFISGAKDAWIADEINDETRLAKVYLRGTQLSYIGSLIAIGISVGLATIHIQIPLVLGGIGFGIIGLYLIAVMPEHGFKPVATEERSGFDNMKETLKTAAGLVKGRPILITIMLVTLFYGLFSEGFDRLWTKHILDRFTLPGEFDSIIWFGIIGAVAMILSIFSNEYLQRRINTDGPVRTVRVLMIITVMLFLGLLGFAQAPFFSLVLAAYWVVGIARSLIYPLWLAWINQYLNPGVRATVMSAASQLDAVGQIAGGPGVGLIGNTAGTRVAITISSMMLVPVLGLYGYVMRKQQKESETPAVQESVVSSNPTA